MHAQYANLKDCREFAVTLRAQPPRIVHGALLTLVTLLSLALGWTWWTHADLVVNAAGRVRPNSPTIKVYCTARDSKGSSGGLRVVAVNYRPGELVHEGDILLRLETQQLENEIAKHQRAIQAAQEELESLKLQERLHQKQVQATKARLDAELEQADAELAHAQNEQVADTRLAQAEVDSAAGELARRKSLLPSRVIVAEEFEKAVATHAIALAKCEKAKLAVDDSKVKIAQRTLAVHELESAVKFEELAARQNLKRGEIATAQLELSNLELDLQKAVILSPIDGIVSAGEIRVGDVLDASKSVLELSELGGFYFEALVPSSEMTHIKTGMPARVRVDAYDYQRYGTLSGRVRYIAPDSTVTEDEKAVSYVVRIELDHDELVRGELRATVKLGLSGDVEIVTDCQSVLGIFLKKIRQTISLG